MYAYTPIKRNEATHSIKLYMLTSYFQVYAYTAIAYAMHATKLFIHFFRFGGPGAIPNTPATASKQKQRKTE